MAASPAGIPRAFLTPSIRRVLIGAALLGVLLGVETLVLHLATDPLADIHNTAKIQWVVKNGELYEAETMRQLWPTERPLPQFFWQK